MAETDGDAQSLELRDYGRVLWRWKGTIIVTTILVTAAAVAFTFTQDKVYEANAEILVERSPIDQIAGSQDSSSGSVNLSTEIERMTSRNTRAEIREELGRPIDVTVERIGDTNVLQITATADTGRQAADDANDYVASYITLRQAQVQEDLNATLEDLNLQLGPVAQSVSQLTGELDARNQAIAALPEGVTDPVLQRERDQFAQDLSRAQARQAALQAQIEEINFALATGRGFIDTIADAGIPESPVEPKPLRTGLLGFALGLVLGIGLAFLREYLDDSIKTKEDVERATGGLNVVGLIPTVPEWKDKTTPQVASMVHPGSPAAEAYRTLRTSIQFLGLEEPIRTLQVTSAAAVEAKTTTVANLAVTLATAGRRVIILCCDLRRPRIHEFFGLSHHIGFTSVLLGEQPLSGALQPVDAEGRLMLLASGPPPPNPSELLASERTAEVIESLTARCDLLLIDSPPVLPVTDAIVLSGFVDATLLVAYAGSTRKRSLHRAVEVLRQVDAPLIGCVLNGARPSEEYGYQYGYHPDAPAKNGSRRERKRQAKAARKAKSSWPN